MVDSCIKMKTIEQYSDEELLVFVANIRERRVKPLREYQDALNRKNEILCAKLKEKISKKLELLKKKLDTLDKTTEAIDKYIQEIRLYRIEAGQYDIDLT